MEEVSGAKKKVLGSLTPMQTPNPNVDGWCIEAMF